MKKGSTLFRFAPLFCSCNICIMLWMGPKECVWSIRCLSKFEERLAFLNVLCVLGTVWRSSSRFVPYKPFHSRACQLITPNREYISEVCCLCISRFCIELLFRNAIFMLALLNRLGMKVVSLPMNVKVAHLCVGTCVCLAGVCSLDASGDGHGMGVLWSWFGKKLICRMF